MKPRGFTARADSPIEPLNPEMPGGITQDPSSPLSSFHSLMTNPGLANELSSSAAAELIVKLTALQTTLLSRILAGEAAAPEGQQGESRMLTIPQVAERLCVPTAYAYELARRGELPTVRLGKKYVRIPLASFERWLAMQERAARPGSAYPARRR